MEGKRSRDSSPTAHGGAADMTQPEPNKRVKLDASSNKNDPKPRASTAVFVSGLPDDVSTEEVRDVFRKYGMIAESADNNEKRVKLYNDQDGNFKGEALIIYFRPESVQMAIDMLDGYPFPRDSELPAGRIQVVEADNNFKKHKDDAVAEDRPEDRSTKAKPSKAKTKKKVEEMNSRLADWDSDEDVSALPQKSSRYDKVVVLKGIFTLQEFESKEDTPEDIQEDVQLDAEEHGVVKNVTVFDQEEDGVVTVRFANAMAAKAFKEACNGRLYGGRYVTASIATGEEKYKKSWKANKDKDEDEAKRLEEYSKFIEGDGHTES